MSAKPPAPPPITAPPKKKKSNEMSPGCAVAFFGIFFLAGAGVMAFFGYQAYRDYRAFFHYQETVCTVLDKRVVVKSDSDGSTYRPEVDFTFKAGGVRYNVTGYDGWEMSSSGRSGKEEAIAPFKRGKQYPVWYDPEDPNKAVLVRHLSWAYLFALIPGIFMAIGFGGIYFTLRGNKRGKSKEAGAFNNRSGLPTGTSPVATDVMRYLGSSDLVPDVKTTPGSTLNEKLERTGDWAGVVGLGCVAIFWNGIICFPIHEAYTSHMKGKPEWLLTIFMIPFVLVGLGIIFGFFHQLLVWLGVGKTVVEVSKARLAPGEAFDLYITQSGKMHMNKFEVKLLAEEKATYRVGTSTRTDTQTVYEETIHEEQHINVPVGRPVEVRATVRIPEDAMHSFKTSNNGLEWRIQVNGDVHRWPDFKRAFALRIEPREIVTEKEGRR